MFGGGSVLDCICVGGRVFGFVVCRGRFWRLFFREMCRGGRLLVGFGLFY